MSSLQKSSKTFDQIVQEVAPDKKGVDYEDFRRWLMSEEVQRLLIDIFIEYREPWQIKVPIAHLTKVLIDRMLEANEQEGNLGGYPPDLESFDEWITILRKIRDGCEILLRVEYDANFRETQKDWKQMEEASVLMGKLMGKYFLHLWD